ncbi:hypothetical protein YC2023_032305 [Brassica napus]
MEEDDFSASLPSFGFSFITGLLSCVAVCTGPENATEITMCCLTGEGCPSTSHYVTKSQLSDSVEYAPSTHPSFVLNLLSSYLEDLFFLIWMDNSLSYLYSRKLMNENIVEKRIEPRKSDGNIQAAPNQMLMIS